MKTLVVLLVLAVLAGLWLHHENGRLARTFDRANRVAGELKNSPQEVVLLGGVLQKRSECLVGPLTRLGISQINFNRAFIGIDGYTPREGFTGRDVMRAEIIRLVLEKQVDNVVLAESEKFGRLFPFTAAKHADIATVITDRLLGNEYESVLAAQGIEVLKA